MPLHLITGHSNEPHITAADVGSFNAGIFGSGEFVLDRGRKFEIEVVNNNLIKIYDGDLIMQGRHMSLQSGSSVELTIENGTADRNRIDLIVARYKQDVATGIESAEFAVIKGTPSTETAVMPEYTHGDILSGGCTVNEMPLYKIPISGLSIGEPEKLFKGCGSVGGAMTFRGWNPLNSIDEDTPKKWKELGTGFWMIDIADRIIGQPNQYGFLYNTVCYGEIAQKFIVQADGRSFRRNANDIGWYGTDWRSGEWVAIYDGMNPGVVANTYSGNGEAEQFIELGFTPSAVIVTTVEGLMNTAGVSDFQSWYGGVATTNQDCEHSIIQSNGDIGHIPIVKIVNNGFKVYYNQYPLGTKYTIASNSGTRLFIAFK